MTWLTWTLIIYYLLTGVALRPVFERAGRDGKLALIPIYNMVVTAEIVGRKRSFGWWMIVPLVNFFIFSYLMIDLARSFGRYSFVDHFLATVAAPIYWWWQDQRKSKTQAPAWSVQIATAEGREIERSTDELVYYGPIVAHERAYREKARQAKKAGHKEQYNRLMKTDPYRAPAYREWISSIIFAVFAAGFIRLFLFEAYMIPTSSMESNLMVGDYLVVSKLHYGLRMPETILTVPLTHNVMPVVGGKSYLEKPQLPYRRLPAIENLDRYDKVVFNVPSGDSVYIFPDRVFSAAQYERGELPPNKSEAIRSGRIELTTRPRDKRDLYVKRTVGLPGDTLEIRDRRIYIDGQLIDDPEGIQYAYDVEFSRMPNTRNWMEWGISLEDQAAVDGNRATLVLNEAQKELLRQEDPQVQFSNRDFSAFKRPTASYPHVPSISGEWTVDNFGPIYIPAAGESIRLTPNNFAIYRRAMEVYEGHDIQQRGRDWFVDGEPATHYTFEQDYYWMMGDNRHGSEDSRVWGFVPQDHIVGKPLVVLFSLREGSLSNGVVWDRLFRWVG